MNRDDTELILSEKFAPADLPDVCAPRLRVMGTVERAVLESPARSASPVEHTVQLVMEMLAPYGFFRVVADEGAAVEPVLKGLVERLARSDYDGSLEREWGLL